jgi:plasmid stability protein
MELTMAVNLSVKNVPDDLAELLRRRAAANRRSLQKELLSILEAAVGGATPRGTGAKVPERQVLTIEQVADLARKLFPRGTESSVDYIRQMRESR